MGDSSDYVAMHCPQIRGEAGKCIGLTITDDVLRIEKVYVSPVALLLIHAGLPIGQYIGRGKLQGPDSEIDLEQYRLDSVDFKPLYTVPFVLRNVAMTRRH